MDERSPGNLMYQGSLLKQELEQRAASLLQVPRLAFLEVSLRQPRFTPPELGFYQIVSWLYCLYFEAGRVSFPFLLERFVTYELESASIHQQHFEHVRSLRTHLQHNLNVDSSEDLKLQRECQGWYSESCGSAIPRNDDEWGNCLVSLLSEAQNFILTAINCIRKIERDESKTMVLEQWLFQLRRYHPRHEFEKLVSVVAKDIGQDFLDPLRICDRYYDKWSKELRLRTGDFNFDTEARKLIEHTLLSDAELPLPITGQDVIRQFGVPPGPNIGRLLKRARVLYNEAPCSKEELLTHLSTSEGLQLKA